MEASMTARARLLTCLVSLALAGTGCEIGIAAGDGAEATFERRLTVSGPVELEVSSGSGDIEVVTGAADTVHVRGRARASQWISFNGEDGADAVRRIEKDPPIEQSGNRILIGRRDRDQRWNGVSISYVISVPANARITSRSGSGDLEVGNVAGPVDASTGSGDIQVGRTTNEVRVRTGSGTIQVHGATSMIARTGSGNVMASAIEGDIEARSGSGDITVAQTVKGRTDVSTGSGDIAVTGVNGPLHVRASSGDVSVEGRPAALWDVTASSGDVHMRLAADAAFDLEVRTGSGRIETALPVTITGAQSRRELKGQVRGGGPRVIVSTSSGSVNLR
jgi:hypothetical protein